MLLGKRPSAVPVLLLLIRRFRNFAGKSFCAFLLLIPFKLGMQPPYRLQRPVTMKVSTCMRNARNDGTIFTDRRPLTPRCQPMSILTRLTAPSIITRGAKDSCAVRLPFLTPIDSRKTHTAVMTARDSDGDLRLAPFFTTNLSKRVCFIPCNIASHLKICLRKVRVQSHASGEPMSPWFRRTQAETTFF